MKRAPLKYIRHSVAGFVVWPSGLDCLAHREVARACDQGRDVAHGKVESAGFVFWGLDGLPYCRGRSDSLNIGHAPGDTNALRAEWGLTTTAAALPCPGCYSATETLMTPAMRVEAQRFAAATCLDGESLEHGDAA